MEEAVGLRSVDADLWVAPDHADVHHMNPLWEPASAEASAAQNAQAGLVTADNIQITYLLPLKIYHTATVKVANVCALPLDQNRTNPIA